jgi:hypothetical protein
MGEREPSREIDLTNKVVTHTSALEGNRLEEYHTLDSGNPKTT